MMRESKFLDTLLSNLCRASRWMYRCAVSCRMDTVLCYAVLWDVVKLFCCSVLVPFGGSNYIYNVHVMYVLCLRLTISVYLYVLRGSCVASDLVQLLCDWKYMINIYLLGLNFTYITLTSNILYYYSIIEKILNSFVGQSVIYHITQQDASNKYNIFFI
jgi:hypothetical protein